MIKLDLKDTYLQVPIHKEYQCLLQFYWEQKTYQFVCLPFGLTSAPWEFTKIMKPVVRKLRQMGICLIVYLGNILIMHQIMEEILQITPLVCQMFKALGLMVNMEKSLLVPQQELEFLDIYTSYKAPSKYIYCKWGRFARLNTFMDSTQ